MGSATDRIIFTEDVVEHPVHPSIVGVVLHHALSSSEEELSDSEEEEEEALAKGHCVVAWYPKGMEEEIEETKLKLIDRALLPGDVIKWVDPAKPTQKGFIKDVHVKVDLQVSGTNYGIKDIEAKKLRPIQEIFTGLPVAYGPWIGIVREVFYGITLRLKNGSRYNIRGEQVNHLVDVTDQRDDDSPFYCFGFYAGQHVSGPARAFREAQWISGTRTIFGNNQRIRGVIEEATVVQARVSWQVSGYVGDLTTEAPPAPGHILEQQDIAKLIPLNLYRAASIQVGDKAFYKLSDEDVAAYWALMNRLKTLSGSSGPDAEPREETAPTTSTATQEGHPENTPQPNSGACGSVDEANPEVSRDVAASSSEGSGDEDDLRGQSAPQTVYRRPDPRSASGFSQTRSHSGRRRRHAARRRRKKLATVRIAREEYVCCEVSRTRTEVDVVWQDGTEVLGISSTELMPGIHLDELEFFPGDFVIDKRTDQATNRLGVVKCANSTERVCQVKWLPGPEIGTAVSSPSVTETLSVYDLADNDDYNFRPSDCVMLLEGAAENAKDGGQVEEEKPKQEDQRPEKTLDNPGVIGQVKYVSPEGQVCVQWSNGVVTHEDCCHVFVVHREDDDEDDSSYSGDDSSDDDSEGWETASDSSEDVPMEGLLDPLEGIIMRSLAALGNRNQGNQNEETSQPPDTLPLSDDPMTGGEATDATSHEEDQKPQNEPATTVASCTSKVEEEEEQRAATTERSYFTILETASPSHHFFHNLLLPVNPRQFSNTVRRELHLLQTSLPAGIHIATFEDRLDLFSILIEGPPDTPYEGGLLAFELQLSPDYPRSPPAVFYLSQCRGRLNPNLYEDGKVCVSLLGTWSGKGTETWTSKSNLCQVMLSLQGLILCAEPYYNEAGYEKHRGTAEGVANSRQYNEMVIIRLLHSMEALIKNPPVAFRTQVHEHYRKTLTSWVAKFRAWIADYGPEGPKAGQTNPSIDYPLFPLSHGFCLTLQRALDRLEAAMVHIQHTD